MSKPDFLEFVRVDGQSDKIGPNTYGIAICTSPNDKEIVSFDVDKDISDIRIWCRKSFTTNRENPCMQCRSSSSAPTSQIILDSLKEADQDPEILAAKAKLKIAN